MPDEKEEEEKVMKRRRTRKRSRMQVWSVLMADSFLLPFQKRWKENVLWICLLLMTRERRGGGGKTIRLPELLFLFHFPQLCSFLQQYEIAARATVVVLLYLKIPCHGKNKNKRNIYHARKKK